MSKLQKLIFFYFIILAVFSGQSILAIKPTQGPTRIASKKLEGYTINAPFEPKTGFFTQLFARKVQFDQYFKAMKGSDSQKIPFETKCVLVCAAPKSKFETILSLDKVIRASGILEVYFKSKVAQKASANLQTAPICMYTIPLERSSSGVVYYMDGKMVSDQRN